jgi:hypothetical protein
MTSWSTWKKRNLNLWEDKEETVELVLYYAEGIMAEWQSCNGSILPVNLSNAT